MAEGSQRWNCKANQPQRPGYIPSIEDIAAVLALADPQTPWWYEGPVRHRVRVILLEIRWTRSWHRADLEARRLVANGRLKNNVRMPGGWDQDNDLGSWIGTLECAICGKTVLQRKHNQAYCSLKCKSRAHYIGATKVALKHCGRCGEVFEGRTVEAKYCSTACGEATKRERFELTQRLRRAARRGVDLYDRPCDICGGHIPESFSLRARFCSDACRHEHRLRYRRAAYKNGNGHASNGHAGNGHADPRGHGRDLEDQSPGSGDRAGGTALAAAPAAPGGPPEVRACGAGSEASLRKISPGAA